MCYTQKGRMISVETPLDGNIPLLTGFAGTEGISTLFCFELRMISECHDNLAESLMGKSVTVSLRLPDGGRRFFNGIVSSLFQGEDRAEDGDDKVISYYRAVIVPEMWGLTLSYDTRIFHDLSVPDIVKKVLDEHGMTEVESALEGSYKPREHCIQYKESHFNFISRLMEEEGIHYFFKHEEGKHTLVLADSAGAHKPCAGRESSEVLIGPCRRQTEDEIGHPEAPGWTMWDESGLCARDFAFPRPVLHPNAPDAAQGGLQAGWSPGYRGFCARRPDEERMAETRMRDEQARPGVLAGSSACGAFSSGLRFKLLDRARPDTKGKEYVLTSVSHRAVQGGFGTRAEGPRETEFAYENRFTCIPADMRYEPDRRTEKPLMLGTQTAVVAGPEGNETRPDELGRIKVRFRWDRKEKRDRECSLWAPVTYPWSGRGWGAVLMLRSGQEVVVEFLNGDPDRPLIVGYLPDPRETPCRPPCEELHREKDVHVVIRDGKIQVMNGNRIAAVGESIEITCGESTMRLDKDGKVTMTGVRYAFQTSGITKGKGVSPN